MVLVIGCHLGLLMLLLRPAIHDPSTTLVARSNPLALKLHFIRQQQTASTHLALPTLRPAASTLRIQGTPPVRAPERPSAQRATHVAAPPETHSNSAPTTPSQSPGNEASSHDGGFQARLRNAQYSYAVHGVPGSDTPSAPGIHLIDPMSRGIGTVMRKTQRLFGITNRHCIDVDAWRHLVLQELSARHISPDNVDKTDEKYDCNRPPGLSF